MANPKLRVGFSLAESDQIQAQHRGLATANLLMCDLLFVPTISSKRAFMEMPLEIPIELWPLGVDPKKFQYSKRDFSDKPFRFLHAGATQFRKGSWLVAEAFVRAFSVEDNVELLISSFTMSDDKPPIMWEQMKNEYGGHPKIKFELENFNNPTRRYATAHVLVSPHLAEGWGLCITEAMALGIPCIVSRCSAPRDYFSKDFGWWVEMSNDYAPVSGCLPETSGFWRLPCAKDLANKMRYAYEHPDQCAEKGLAASEYAHRNLCWETGIKSAMKKIEAMVKLQGKG